MQSVTFHDKPLAVRRRAALVGVTFFWALAAVFLMLAIHSA